MLLHESGPRATMFTSESSVSKVNDALAAAPQVEFLVLEQLRTSAVWPPSAISANSHALEQDANAPGL